MTPREAARLLLRARQALLLAASVLSGVWAWRHQGLFRLFADTQMRLTGGYDASFALLFTFLTLFVISMALGSVLTALMRRRFSKEDSQTLLNDTTMTEICGKHSAIDFEPFHPTGASAQFEQERW